MTSFFVKDATKVEISPDDKKKIHAAFYHYIITDMQPYDSINMKELTELISEFTGLGALYGTLSVDQVSDILRSRNY